MDSLDNESSTPMSGCFQQTKEEEEAWLFALQLANCAVLPMTLKAAIELGVFEVIVKAGTGKYLSPMEITDKLSISNTGAPAMLDRILRCLASYNILTYRLDDETCDGITTLYGAAPVCKYLTKNDEGVSISALALMLQDKVLMESWHYLKDAVVDGGISFNKTYGMAVFEYLREDFRFNKVFNASMSNHSTMTMKKILCSYTGFDGLNTVVDVGGGVGATLAMIVSKHPSIKGINFDLPHVIADAPAIKGVEHVGGDMFESVPSGDAIFMKWILHDWSDEHCLMLLKNCWKALPETGKVIIAEGILPIAPESSLAARAVIELDMLMLAQTGGKERTEKEFMLLAKKSGFSTFKIACSLTGVFVMEFTK